MAHQRLNKDLVERIASDRGIQESSVRERCSRLAGKLHVKSEAALIAWGQKLRLHTTRAFNELDPALHEQVSKAAAALDGGGSPAPAVNGPEAQRTTPTRPPTELQRVRAVVPDLLSDSQLNARCADLITASGPRDRAVREATTVLEARLREKTGLSKTQVPKAVDLVAMALHPDKDPLPLRVSSEKSEQLGFYYLVLGTFLVPRNTSHHELSDKMSRWDALRLCGLIDYLLTTIEGASTR